MTIDLEPLRAALGVMDEAIREAERATPTPFRHRGESPRRIEHHIDYRHDLSTARKTVELALTELTARRARDVEVEALVAALRLARNDIASLPRNLAYVITTLPKIDAALLPFAGDTP